MGTAPLTPEDYIHQILPNVLVVNTDDQSRVFELALHLTKMYDHAIDTIKAVLGDKCCIVETALDIIQEVREGAYELWRGVTTKQVGHPSCVS